METKIKTPNSTAQTVLAMLQEITAKQSSPMILQTNAYFAKRLERGPKEVQRAFASLRDNGYITIDVDYLRQPVRIIKLVTNP
jgi:hypothetical protein